MQLDVRPMFVKHTLYACCDFSRFLFPHIGHEVKQSNDSFNWTWFNKLQAQYSAGFRMSPQQCRHLFVGERSGDQAVPGPSAAAAAVVMGNSQESECDCRGI